MRKVLFNLHLYLALFTGIFVVIVGVSGSIMAFEEEIDHATNPKFFKVEPRGQRLSAGEMLAAAAKAYPGQKIGSLRLPQGPDNSAGFGVRGQQVFLNPYTGVIIGSRDPKTWLSNVHQLHLRLLMEPTGKTVVAAITGILLFLVISGIYLWWPQKRAAIKWSGNSWRVNFDIHNTVGIYSAVLLLALGFSGLIVHFDNEIEQSLHKMAGTEKVGKNTPSTAVPGAARITPDQAIASALDAIPGTAPLSISVPQNQKGTYLVALRFPEDLTPGGRSWANVDQYSGKVINLQNSRTVATGTRVIILNRALHTGDILGVFTKILMSLTALMLVGQAITGYFMWWKKLRARQRDESERASETFA